MVDKVAAVGPVAKVAKLATVDEVDHSLSEDFPDLGPCSFPSPAGAHSRKNNHDFLR